MKTRGTISSNDSNRPFGPPLVLRVQTRMPRKIWLSLSGQSSTDCEYARTECQQVNSLTTLVAARLQAGCAQSWPNSQSIHFENSRGWCRQKKTQNSTGLHATHKMATAKQLSPASQRQRSRSQTALLKLTCNRPWKRRFRSWALKTVCWSSFITSTTCDCVKRAQCLVFTKRLRAVV